MKLANNVSVVIFTHNRSSFVKRFAGSLESMDYGGHLIIAESSDAENFDKTKACLSALNVEFKVTHIHVEKEEGETISQSMNNCIREGVSRITSKYAMLSCDDDIPVPVTLQKCEDFLNDNAGFNGANGEYVWYDVGSENNVQAKPALYKYLLPFWAYNFNQGRRRGLNGSYHLEGRTAAERLHKYVRNLFHTMFVVVRAETLNHIIPENSNQISFPHFAADYCWMFSIAMMGNIKHFKQPQVIRQFHSKNLSIKNADHPFPSYLDGLLQDTWGSDSRMFVSYLSTILAARDKLEPDIAYSHALDAYREITVRRLSVRVQSDNKFVRLLKSLYMQVSSRVSTLKYEISWCENSKIYNYATASMSNFVLEDS